MYKNQNFLRDYKRAISKGSAARYNKIKRIIWQYAYDWETEQLKKQQGNNRECLALGNNREDRIRKKFLKRLKKQIVYLCKLRKRKNVDLDDVKNNVVKLIESYLDQFKDSSDFAIIMDKITRYIDEKRSSLHSRKSKFKNKLDVIEEEDEYVEPEIEDGYMTRYGRASRPPDRYQP